MVQLAFVAILPFVLPALGANMQARNNWGSSIAATPVPITSTVFASPAFPTGVISSIAASPALPSGDVGTTTVVAIPAPSYFDCGGSNFTITSSIGGVPTGVTTVVVPIGTASSWASSGPVGTASSWTSSVAAGTPSVISSRLAARENWGISSSFAVPTSVAASSSFIPGGTASASSFTFIPGGTASGSGGVCPFPTSTAYASSSGIVSVSASPSGSLASGAQLGQQGGSDAGSAIGMTVSAGSVILGAIAVVAQLL